MPTTIVFSSEKGGVGKTTSAVNLAMALAIGGYKVLLIDMDPQGSVRLSFGLKGPLTAGTRQLLTQPALPLADTCVHADGGQALDYISANFDNLVQQRETECDHMTSHRRDAPRALPFSIPAIPVCRCRG